MKVLALGKISQTKYCNLGEGTVFQFIDSDLTLKPEILMKVEGGAVNLETGKLLKSTTHFHTSNKCKIFQDACIVLNPVDRD